MIGPVPAPAPALISTRPRRVHEHARDAAAGVLRPDRAAGNGNGQFHRGSELRVAVATVSQSAA